MGRIPILHFLLILVSSQLLEIHGFRLPRTLIPVSYNLRLISVLDEIPEFPIFTAPGQATIRLRCVNGTNIVTLHALDLVIPRSAVKVTSESGEDIPVTSFEDKPELEWFELTLARNLTIGDVIDVFVPFTAPISDTRLDGIYLDSYVDPANNQTRYVSTTLFAAISARRAFPCMDEPDLKAVFNINIGRHGSYHSLSNTEILETTDLPEISGWFLDTFAPSPNMSTYLVCMIVSDLKQHMAMEGEIGEAVHSVWAPYYFIDRGGGGYSANLSLTVNRAFQTYYNSTFPLNKLDNVALPQFFYNAMENWGLMTYADRVLLYFEGETSEAQKYQLSLTVSHEVSHNFFGNLVTAKWWTWIWLNEGWATFASHQGLFMTYPELRPWEMFVPQIYQVAMTMDESINTHPISSEPMSTNEVHGVYDDIVYEKAASVIRMMQDFLGEAVLQNGMRRYLDSFEFKVAEETDLFGFIQEAVDYYGKVLPAPVTEIMQTWTLQSGYPLISVSRVSPTEIMLAQSQFVNNGVPSGNESWWVPVTIQDIPDNTTRLVWIGKGQKNVTTNMNDDQLFYINPLSIGYFRVQYEAEMYEEFARTLGRNKDVLSPQSRAKLLDDAFTLALAGQIAIEIPLSLTAYLHEETHFMVWKMLEERLFDLYAVLQGTLSGNLFADNILAKIRNLRLSLKSSTFSTVEFGYLISSLDKIQQRMETTTQKFSESEVFEKISTVLSQKGNEDDEEILVNMAVSKETRLIIIQQLTEKLLEDRENKRMITRVFTLLSKILKLSNTTEDLKLTQSISDSLKNISMPCKESNVIKESIYRTKEKIQAQVKLATKVKAWLMKR